MQEIHIETLGDVDPNMVLHVRMIITDVFNKLMFNGPPPEGVRITSGRITLPEGGNPPACYEFPKTGVPGWIMLSTTQCIEDTDIGPNVIEYVVVAAFAAHEAVEHVQNMRGKKLLLIKKLISHAEHRVPSEIFANAVARSVISERYDVNFQFGDDVWAKENL